MDQKQQEKILNYPQYYLTLRRVVFHATLLLERKINNEIVAVGFSRYDSTRGGAQSDDRTGGNSLKVQKLKSYKICSGKIIKIIFLSDGPGLIHNDTWKETCMLADSWEDNVRVTTLKISSYHCYSGMVIIVRYFLCL